ncbi:hypothetical protein BDM02DRAFT_314661 [Thelephora ganbajun]|uniref:Uncharacterized protein n=1 Tax=Thelephora ganbajun TaxID=370292 RepID=A0ACB6Z995_THEGA|nr:hypothetical protein BDM02DRAFT_314661 [Thelephora ganbajun]
MKGFLCLLARTLQTCARSLPSFGLIGANYRGYLSAKGVACPVGPQSKRWKLLKKKPSKSLPLAVPISSPIDCWSTFKSRGNPCTRQAHEGKKVVKSSWQGERFVSEGEDFDLRIQRRPQFPYPSSSGHSQKAIWSQTDLKGIFQVGKSVYGRTRCLFRDNRSAPSLV